MKEIIIAAVAVATLMSCQSEKDKLIDSKIASIDARLDYDISLEDHEYFQKLMERDVNVEYTEKERKFINIMKAKINYYSQLEEEREFWVLQK